MPSDGEVFFWSRLADVATAFERSPVKRLQEDLRRPGSSDGHWYYSLTALPIVRRRPLLLGLNWKAKNTEAYAPQSAYPGKRDWLDVVRWPHVWPERDRLSKYLATPFDRMNYFNVCPFRSRDLKDLTNEDWRLGIESFFEATMEFVSPPGVLIMGTEGVKQLASLGLADYRDIPVLLGSKTVTGKTGILRGAGHAFPFWAIPRPRDLHSESYKDQLWESIFAHRPS